MAITNRQSLLTSYLLFSSLIVGPTPLTLFPTSRSGSLLCSAQPVTMYSEKQLITLSDTTLQALKKDEVIPDVIHGIPDWKPSVFPNASFSESVSVNLGNFIPKAEAKSAPSLMFSEGEPTKGGTDSRGYSAVPPSLILARAKQAQVSGGASPAKYTICMTDPDAKSRQTHESAEFLHWLVTDVTIPDDSKEVDFTQAKSLMDYMGPAPPQGKGKHRYVIMVFRNGDKEPVAPENRPHWGYKVGGTERVGAMKYAADNGLILVGADYFFSEF